MQVATCPTVPPVVNFLGKADMVDEYDISSLTDVICGAAPLSVEQQNLLQDRLGLQARQGETQVVQKRKKLYFGSRNEKFECMKFCSSFQRIIFESSLKFQR